MTTRRTILQGAASLIAPAGIDLRNPFDLTAAESPFGILIGEYRQMVAQLDGLFAARNRIEKAAIARKDHVSGCPELDVIEQNTDAWYDAEKKLIRLASRTRAASIDEVVQKLILWRLVDFDRGGFDEPRDMIPFSAYRDLLLLTGRASLTEKSDEKALAIVWDDNALYYSDDDEDDDFDEDDDDFDDGKDEDAGE
jgi:hypothetical protein